jgi:hypothetical protein
MFIEQEQKNGELIFKQAGFFNFILVKIFAGGLGLFNNFFNSYFMHSFFVSLLPFNQWQGFCARNAERISDNPENSSILRHII